MSALEVFNYDGAEVRTVLIQGEAWFVAADVCRVLEISNSRDAVARLDEDGVGTADIIDKLGRPQSPTILSEAALYELAFQSRKPEARGFRRWVTAEVIPTIRRTGSYTVPESPEQLMARAVLQAQELIAQRDAQVAELTPRAEAWDELASAEGDYSVGDAAKMLARAGVETGPQRLFDQLRNVGWIFRAHDGKWRAYASAVDAGYLAERPQSHHHPRSGDLVIDAPQVRVTIRGIERLRVRLGSLMAVGA